MAERCHSREQMEKDTIKKEEPVKESTPSRSPLARDEDERTEKYAFVQSMEKKEHRRKMSREELVETIKRCSLPKHMERKEEDKHPSNREQQMGVQERPGGRGRNRRWQRSKHRNQRENKQYPGSMQESR